MRPTMKAPQKSAAISAPSEASSSKDDDAEVEAASSRFTPSRRSMKAATKPPEGNGEGKMDSKNLASNLVQTIWARRFCWFDHLLQLQHWL